MIVTTLLLSVSFAAAEPERLFVTQVRGDDETLCATLERAVVERAAEAGYDAMSTAELRSLVDVEVQRQIAGCEDDSCLAEIAEGVGARMTVNTQLTKLGAQFLVSLTLLDTVQAKVLARERAEAADPVALVAQTRSATSRLLGHDAAPPLEPVEPADLTVPLAATGVILAVGGVVTAGFGLAPLLEVGAASASADDAAANWLRRGDSAALEDLEAAHLAHVDASERWNGLGVILVATGALVLVVGGGLTAFAFAE